MEEALRKSAGQQEPAEREEAESTCKVARTFIWEKVGKLYAQRATIEAQLDALCCPISKLYSLSTTGA